MIQSFIVADDLTGANVTGAALKAKGISGFTVTNIEMCREEHFRDYDVLLCNTDTRGMSGKEAYRTVFEVLNRTKDREIPLYVNRIDSTLRGNLGSETDAFLDFLGKEYIAVVAPAMESGGRIVAGGKMYVNGVPLHETSVSKDPKMPVFTSDVKELFDVQTKYRTESVYLKEIRKGSEYLAERIRKLRESGVRILIFDGENENDREILKDAVQKADVPFVIVGPGAFTAAVCEARIRAEKRMFLVVGSVNSVTRRQIEYIGRRNDVYLAYMRIDKLTGSEQECAEEVERTVEDMERNGKNYPVCGIVLNSIYSENRIDFSKVAKQRGISGEELSEYVNHMVAATTQKILKRCRFSSVFSCGGDITVALCLAFGAAGIEIRDQVLPLIMYGRFVDGKKKGLEIITKGGMVGDDEAIDRCIRYIRKEKNY
jgi:uncharacterized protein YgbK (DUF1537 family)